MVSLETLALLNAGTMSLSSLSSSTNRGDQLTKVELSAVLSGLNETELLFAQAKYCLDNAALQCVIDAMVIKFNQIAGQKGWRVRRGNEVIENMVSMAAVETIEPNRCTRCNGTGSTKYKLCSCCQGSGYRRLSGREIAEYVQVSERQWRQRWRDRYEEIVKTFQDIDFKVKITIKSNTKEHQN